MNAETTMAQSLISDLEEAVSAVTQQPGSEHDPIRGLTQLVEIKCDALLDARVMRTVREQYNGQPLAEDFVITFPDDSVITALAEWCADRIHPTTGQQDDDRWLFNEHHPRRTTLHPDGAPGNQLFEIMATLPDNCRSSP